MFWIFVSISVVRSSFFIVFLFIDFSLFLLLLVSLLMINLFLILISIWILLIFSRLLFYFISLSSINVSPLVIIIKLSLFLLLKNCGNFFCCVGIIEFMFFKDIINKLFLQSYQIINITFALNLFENSFT